MKANRRTNQRQSPALAVMKSTLEVSEQIRRRAYELYEHRGSTEGNELNDWLQAEAEVTGQNDSAITT